MENQNERQITSYIDSAREHFRQHDVTLAFDVLWELSKVEPENADVSNLIAKCYYIWGDFDKAELYWERALQEAESHQEASSGLAALRSPAFQFWLKRYYEAVDIIENKNYEEGRALLWLLLKENDGFVGLYQLLGLCYLASSDKITARKVWSRGLEIDRSNKLLMNYLDLAIINAADTFVETKNQKTFQPKLLLPKGKIAWALSGTLCLALIIQAGIYFKNKQDRTGGIHERQAQVEVLSSAVETRTASAAQEYKAAGISEDSAKIKDMNASGGADYDYEHEKDYYLKGYNAYLARDFKTAGRNLAVVVSMNTRSYLNREALYYLARINYLTANYYDAESYFQKFVQDFPDSNYYDESLFYLGCIYESTNRSELALKTFEKLQETMPDSGYLTARVVKDVMKAE